uniref:BOS complex subunit TMEM147 n=1 Tax=Panagrolaimus sp. PS1159 TaxID=55785 RepID=A0AC35GKD9_9BILA
MTFFHFLNCVALAYIPLIIIYKYSGFSEYCSIWRCLRATGVYFVTQFVKMMILATFFPDLETEEFSVILEFFKSLADGIDILGLYLAITYLFSGRGEVRFFAAGYGFAIGHAIGTFLVPFLTVARATAFHPKYIQYAMEANLDLVYYLAFAAIIWLQSRHDISSKNRTIVFLSLALCGLKSFFYGMLQHSAGLSSWSLIGAKFGLTTAYAALAFHAYSLYRSQSNPVHVKRH